MEPLAIHGGRPVRSGPPIPLSRPSFGAEELDEIREVFDQGVFCAINPGATKVKQLEAALAEVTGARHVIATSSGATAQHATLSALDIGPGDEVIVPSLTFYSTAYTVLLQNAIPVFAEVDPDTITLDPDDVRRRVSARTRAIVPVHWFGRPAEMDTLLEIAAEHDLFVIEDCAHAFGTTYRGRPAGSLGHLAAWSMQESKLITSAGDGGFITTNDDRLAERARMARDHGRRPKATPPGQHDYERLVEMGNHYRLTEVQAAFALAQLRKLPSFRERRRQATEALDAGLRGIEGLAFQQREGDFNLSYGYYPVLFRTGHFAADIDEITAAFAAEGVTTYPIAKDEMCHVQPVFTNHRGRGRANCPFDCCRDASYPPYGRGTLPVSEQVGEELILLPLFPDLTSTDIEDVIRAVWKVAEGLRASAQTVASSRGGMAS